MKRKLWLLPLLLALVLTLTAIPVLADDGTDTATFMLGTTTVSQTTIQNGSVKLPSAPIGAVGFVGWTASVGDRTIFLPAGASCGGLSGDVTFAAVTVSYATDEGCSVRLRDDFVALRFTSTIATADYNRLVLLAGGKEKISFGTYIVPAKYVSYTNSIFTLEALDANGFEKYIDVPAGDFYKSNETSSVIAGSVGHIRKGNYTLEYTGRGYMKVTYQNGETRTVYSDYKYASYSITRAVLSAYNDRNETYENLIVEPSGSTHSPYTDTQLKLCRDFLDQIVMVMHDTKYQYFAYTKGYYTSPWKIDGNKDGNSNNTIYCEPPAGMTADSAMGIFLDGKVIPLAWSRIENGRVVFEYSDFVTVT